MKCKYCEKVEIEWPENYQTGMKPIESETGVEHNMERCKDIQNSNIIKNDGWVRFDCKGCGSDTRQNRKHIKSLSKCIECNG